MCFTSPQQKAAAGWPRVLPSGSCGGPGAEAASSAAAARRTSPPGQLWFPLSHPGEHRTCHTASADTHRASSSCWVSVTALSFSPRSHSVSHIAPQAERIGDGLCAITQRVRRIDSKPGPGLLAISPHCLPEKWHLCTTPGTTSHRGCRLSEPAIVCSPDWMPPLSYFPAKLEGGFSSILLLALSHCTEEGSSMSEK